MKKFEKILKIIACTCIVVFFISVGLSIITFNKYGNSDSFSSMLLSNNFINNLSNIFHEEIKFEDNLKNKSEKSLEENFDKDKIKNIKIDSNKGQIKIMENSTTDKVKIKIDFQNFADINLDSSGNLNMKIDSDKDVNNNILIEMPTNINIDNLQVYLDLGEMDFDLSKINLKNCEIENKMGSVNLTSSEYKIINSMDIRLYMGDLYLKNIDSCKGKIKNNLGEITIIQNNDNNNDKNFENLDVICNAGSIESEFNYLNRDLTFKNDMGNIRVISKNDPINMDLNLENKSNVINDFNIKEDSNNPKRIKLNINVKMGEVELR